MAFTYPHGKYQAERIRGFPSYNAGGSFSIELNKRNISRLFGSLQVSYSVPGGGLDPADAVEDGLAKLVKNLRVEIDDGARLPIHFLHLQQAHLYSYHLFGGALRNDQPAAPGAGNSKTGYVDFIITPSLNPYQPQDLHYCIPGEVVSKVTITGQWGDLSDVFGTANDVQIDSATLKVKEEASWIFAPDMQALRNAIGVDGQGYVPLPVYSVNNESLTASPRLGESLALPTDATIRRIFLITKDSGGNRSDSLVTEFALQTAEKTNLLGPLDFDVHQRLTAERMDIAKQTGCLMIHCVDDVRDPQFATKKVGLIVQEMGKLAIRLSTTAAGSLDYLFDSVTKVPVVT